MLDYKKIINLKDIYKILIRFKFNVKTNKIIVHHIKKKLLLWYKKSKNQNFKFTSKKQIYITKFKKHSKYLKILSQDMYLFQAIFFNSCIQILKKISLNSIYKNSLKRESSSTIRYLKKTCRNVLYRYKIHVFPYIKDINFNLILNIFKNYLDKITINIFKKFLQNKYDDHFFDIKYFRTVFLFKFLFNFYFHYFDLFIFNNLLLKIRYIRKFMTTNFFNDDLTIKNIWNKSIKNTTPTNYFYIRHTNEILLGFNAYNYKQIKFIKNYINKFFEKRLFLNYSFRKICKNSYFNQNFFYLGYSIQYVLNNKLKLGSWLIKQNGIKLKIPFDIIFLHAIAKGYAYLRKDGVSINPISYSRIVKLKNFYIIKKFSSIIYKILKYYKSYFSYKNIRFLLFFYRKICALTLAVKYRIKTKGASFKKFNNLI